MAKGNNTIIVSGRLGQDIKIDEFGDKLLGSSTIAVNRGRQDKDGEWITDWFRFKIWNRMADKMADKCRKGDTVNIVGSMIIDKWEDRDGNNRETPVIEAAHFTLIQSNDR
jgi:single-strand DNA-binding protein